MLGPMTSKYFCPNCNAEFVLQEASDEPRCPKCLRRGTPEPMPEPRAENHLRSPWLLLIALVIVAAGIGLGLYMSTRTVLEETPPLRPLEPRELSAYLERDQIGVGAYESMLVLSGETGDWPSAPAEIASLMHARSASWSLERPLTREVLTAEQTLAILDAHDERVEVYPLEVAAAMTVLLREHGMKAMVAEAWELEGARSPADPSGVLGYFVTAVYDDREGNEPLAFFDPWGGRGEVELSSVRVLSDPEILAAALGTEAARIFARSGDATTALAMAETALLLDPVSPTLRAVNATVLVDSGGIAEAVKEFEAAAQLRSDGPRQLSLAQLHLAQAGILEMNAEPAAAEAQFGEANRIVTDVIERWPRFGRAHVVLATIYLGMDQLERAQVELEAAEALAPDAPLLWAVWAQYDLQRDDMIGAAAKIQRGVGLDPQNWQLRLQAGRVLRNAGRDEAAKENFAEAMEMVQPAKRDEVRQFIERMVGAAANPASAPAQAAPADPALQLGDPSNLRLRDPDQALKLDLDE
jgi:tetratricopeptide (TPR) repeat protein